MIRLGCSFVFVFINAKDKRKQAFNRIMAVHQLINQAVGDAMSDCLLIEALLILKGWKIADWDAIYADLPR